MLSCFPPVAKFQIRTILRTYVTVVVWNDREFNNFISLHRGIYYQSERKIKSYCEIDEQ